MKYIYITLWLITVLFLFTGQVDAISIEVTEKIPGANCTKAWDGIYNCDPGKGFESVTNVLWEMIKFFTYIAALSAVLYIVINGILYSMAWINDGLKWAAKDRIVKTLSWLVILLLAWVILNAIAPWIYTG